MGPGQRPIRPRTGAILAGVLVLGSLGWPSLHVLAQSPAPVTDFTIVSDARVLSMAEVQAADISTTDRGRQLIDAHVLDTMDSTTGAREYAAYDLDGVSAVLDVTTPFSVVAGSNGMGQQVHQVVPRTNAMVAPEVIDPSGTGLTWSHVQDASATILTGDCWKRVLWWTVATAPGSFDDLGPGAAYRAYGRVLASPRAAVGCEGSAGFRRAWIEFSPAPGWPGGSDFEPAQPAQHIGGGGDPAIRFVGFGSIYATDLGDPPPRPDGAADLRYGGVINQRWAAHRAMGDKTPASGGVRWCLFFDHPTPDRVSFAARVSAVVAAGGEMGSLDIHTSQDTGWEDCPPPD